MLSICSEPLAGHGLRGADGLRAAPRSGFQRRRRDAEVPSLAALSCRGSCSSSGLKGGGSGAAWKPDLASSPALPCSEASFGFVCCDEKEPCLSVQGRRYQHRHMPARAASAGSSRWGKELKRGDVLVFRDLVRLTVLAARWA